MIWKEKNVLRLKSTKICCFYEHFQPWKKFERGHSPEIGIRRGRSVNLDLRFWKKATFLYHYALYAGRHFVVALEYQIPKYLLPPGKNEHVFSYVTTDCLGFLFLDYETEKFTTPTSSSPQQTVGGLVFSTTSAPFDCRVGGDTYRDGESIAMVADKPCQHCYCMRGDIVCAVQECGEPLRGKDCTPEIPPHGQCCPTSYQCGMFKCGILTSTRVRTDTNM